MLGLLAQIAATLLSLQIQIAKAQELPKPEHTRWLNAIVTMYTADPSETDSSPEYTADGTHVGPSVAACPAWLEFGTRIEIAGKIYFCHDRMAPRYRNALFFDLWSNGKQDALNFGRERLDIIVYEN